MLADRLDHAWPAMGSTARVVLVGDPGRADQAEVLTASCRGCVELVAALERRWSRFSPASDVTRINEAGGRPVLVERVTAALIADAVGWSTATGGRFDPTVLAAVRDAGYVRSLTDGPDRPRPAAPAPGPTRIQVDPAAAAVLAPAGVTLDLGGIGKGRAVDLVMAHLARSSVAGALVDLGGDLRVWGTPPDDLAGWPIAIEDPRSGARLAVLRLARGAVATSSTLTRRWSVDGLDAHHLIDPATGRPTRGELVAATVVAGEATGAEVLAKAAIVAGSVPAATRLLADHGAAAVLIPRTGEPVRTGGLDDLRWPGAPEAAA